MSYPWQQPHLPSHLLLDPGNSPRWQQWLAGSMLPRLALFHYLELPCAASPFLLDCAGMDDTAWQTILRLNRRHAAVAYLWSSLPASQLAPQLASRIRPHTSLGQIVFRYYDPRLWSRLPTVLNPAQWQQLMAPLDACAMHDPDGCWFEWACGPAVAAGHEPWQLDDDVLEACADWGLTWQLRDLPANLAPLAADEVHALLLRARAMGLSSRPDLACFASLGMRIHPAFDLDPVVAAQLGGLAAGQSLNEVLARVPDEVWDRLAAGSGYRGLRQGLT